MAIQRTSNPASEQRQQRDMVKVSRERGKRARAFSEYDNVSE
jgi:hypothetical protein